MMCSLIKGLVVKTGGNGIPTLSPAPLDYRRERGYENHILDIQEKP